MFCIKKVHLARALKGRGEFQEALSVLDAAEEMSADQGRAIRVYKEEVIKAMKEHMLSFSKAKEFCDKNQVDLEDEDEPAKSVKTQAEKEFLGEKFEKPDKLQAVEEFEKQVEQHLKEEKMKAEEDSRKNVKAQAEKEDEKQKIKKELDEMAKQYKMPQAAKDFEKQVEQLLEETRIETEEDSTEKESKTTSNIEKSDSKERDNKKPLKEDKTKKEEDSTKKKKTFDKTTFNTKSNNEGMTKGFFGEEVSYKELQDRCVKFTNTMKDAEEMWKNVKEDATTDEQERVEGMRKMASLLGSNLQSF